MAKKIVPQEPNIFDIPAREEAQARIDALTEALEYIRDALGGSDPAVTAAWSRAHQVLGPTPEGETDARS